MRIGRMMPLLKVERVERPIWGKMVPASETLCPPSMIGIDRASLVYYFVVGIART